MLRKRNHSFIHSFKNQRESDREQTQVKVRERVFSSASSLHKCFHELGLGLAEAKS